MPDYDNADVNTPTTEYTQMLQDWHLPMTLMGGQRAMREAGTIYLPKEPAESDALYLNRLNRSILTNMYKDAVKSLTGRVFSKPISLSDDTNSKIVEYNDNIDLLGSDINTFYRNVFEDALVKGLSFVLVEHPVNNSTTLAEERENGIRPYCIHIRAEQVIRAVPAYVNGRVELGRVHIRERVQVPSGRWGTTLVDQVRVLYPGAWEVWRLGGKNTWNVVESGTNTLSYIPLAVYYNEKVGFMMGHPPLMDLATLNLGHWQSDSDQRNILHVARVPILFGTGLDGEEIGELEIGANRLVLGPDGSDLKFVEHSGKAIESGDKDIQNLEERMSKMAMEPALGSRSGVSDGLESNKANASLQDMALRLQDTIDIVNGMMANWMGLDSKQGGKAIVNRDFGLMKRDGSETGVLLKTRQNRSLTNATLLKEYKKRGLLSDDFDLDSELKELEKEKKEAEAEMKYTNEFGKQVVGDKNTADLDFGKDKIE